MVLRRRGLHEAKYNASDKKPQTEDDMKEWFVNFTDKMNQTSGVCYRL